MSRNSRLILAIALLAITALACSAFGGSESTAATDVPAATNAPANTGPSGAALQFGLGSQTDIANYYANSNIFHLEDFAVESYTQDEYNTPGTLVFTIEDPGATDVAVESSWCADTLDLALDDWQYMHNTFTINGEQISAEYVYMDQWETEDGDGCVSDSILITEWPSGTHSIQVLIQQSADLGDVPAGDYIWDYRVSIP